MVTSYAQIAARGGTCAPGGGRRDGMPADRPYLPPSQRAVLAVVARAGRVRVADLPGRLGRLRGDLRPAVASLALCGLVRVEERLEPPALVLTASGQRVAADRWLAHPGRCT